MAPSQILYTTIKKIHCFFLSLKTLPSVSEGMQNKTTKGCSLHTGNISRPEGKPNDVEIKQANGKTLRNYEHISSIPKAKPILSEMNIQ